MTPPPLPHRPLASILDGRARSLQSADPCTRKCRHGWRVQRISPLSRLAPSAVRAQPGACGLPAHGGSASPSANEHAIAPDPRSLSHALARPPPRTRKPSFPRPLHRSPSPLDPPCKSDPHTRSASPRLLYLSRDPRDWNRGAPPPSSKIARVSSRGHLSSLSLPLLHSGVLVN
jgi:hypothetical protein